MKKTIVLIMDGVLAAILIAFVVVAVVNINNNANIQVVYITMNH